MNMVRTHTKKNDGNRIIPSIPDIQWCNIDHVPVYRNLPGNYSWGESGSGRRQVDTGGLEK